MLFGGCQIARSGASRGAPVVPPGMAKYPPEPLFLG